MIELSSKEELKQAIANGDKCLLDFYTTWCGPCKMLTPELVKLEKMHPDWKIIRIDAEKFPEIFRLAKADGVPTICVMIGSEVFKEVVTGYRPVTELEKIISKY